VIFSQLISYQSIIVDNQRLNLSAARNLSHMVTHNKGSQKRLMIALTLFFASVLASLFITLAAQKGDDYWVLATHLPAGAVVESSDLTLRSALLTFGANNYLQSRDNPLGMVTSRSLRAGELLSKYDLKEIISSAPSAQLAISMQSSDIPTSISVGDSVSIYQLFDSQNNEPLQSPKKILVNSFVVSIDREGFKFGGEAVVTLAIATDQVEVLLASKSRGRLVMVASYD